LRDVAKANCYWRSTGTTLVGVGRGFVALRITFS
jgi:hypothetical protein